METAGTTKKFNGLRQYRFQKTFGASTATTSNNLIDIPGRKRIQAINDSDSDIEKSPKKTGLSVADKESCLVKLKSLKPEVESMVLQDALFRNDWCVTKAIEYLKNIPTPKRKKMDSNDNSENNHTSKSSKHKKSRNSDDSDSDVDKPAENVFDSDEDDDVEVGSHMNKHRIKVLDFMNNADEKDFLSIKTCSGRKAEILASIRPFRNWHELVTKIQNQKALNTDILNHCQALLVRRANLVAIMKKCNKIVQRLESTISDKEVTKQPTIMSPNLKLAEYQLVGLNWLVLLHKEETNGILADEMGLGKTVQVISFLGYLKENNLSTNTHLVIVPSSTLDNWQLEFQKWCPDLIVEKYYGSAEERRMLRFQWAKTNFQGIDVILTTYRCVMSSPEEKKMFRVTPIHYVIFDEAHMLKNMTSQRYEYLVRIHAKRRILLTGTPLQNNLLELMSLLCFVMPSIFANKSDDIKSLFQKNKTKLDNEEDSNVFEQSQIEQAKRVMKPFVLRRLKKDVLSYLPKKTEEIIKVPPTEAQKVKYTELVESFSREGVVTATQELSGMAMMMDMRKLSNHPLLLRYYYSDEDVRSMAKILARETTYKGENPDYIFDDLAILSDFQLHLLQDKYPVLRRFPLPNNLIDDAGKIKQLDMLLPKLQEEGHRVLIFSQFIIMLDILEKYLELRNYRYMRLDGQTAVMDRQDMITEYNEDSDYFVFLLSTRAGGLGINLTAADTVIIYDIDFNPYNDKQAEDRCHRIGQTRPVQIYKLISEGTIDEGMLMVAQEKLNLEKEVTNDNKDEEEKQEHKSMVRLLTMSLGMKTEQAEVLLSPTVKQNVVNNCNDTTEDF